MYNLSFKNYQILMNDFQNVGWIRTVPKALTYERLFFITCNMEANERNLQICIFKLVLKNTMDDIFLIVIL